MKKNKMFLTGRMSGKLVLRRALTILCMLCMLCSSVLPMNAMESSKNYTTGHEKDEVIKKYYQYYGGGRSRGKYTKAKDIYVSEKVITDKWVKDLTGDWNDTSSTDKLKYTKGITISASGSVDVIKALGLKTTLSISKAANAGADHKVNPKKGSYAKLAVKCDFVEITYKHITYNRNGKQTGSTTKTVLVPIPDTAVVYVRYKN